MAAEEAMNEQTSDELRSLRRRLRKLRRKQDKKPKLRQIQYHPNQSENGTSEARKESSTAGPSSDFVAAKEWVQRREKKREERNRRSKKKSSRHSRHGEAEGAISKSRRSSRRNSENVAHHSSKLRTGVHDSGRSLANSEHEPAIARRNTIDLVDVPPSPPKRSHRSHQTMDDSEEFSLKQTKKSFSKSKGRRSSDRKQRSERSINREQTMKPSPPEKHRNKTAERQEKRPNHISVDFSAVPSLSCHQGQSGEGNEGSRLDDNDSLFNDDASIETYWGERYFQLQSEYTAEEAIEMLREEKEMMRELEAEKRELQRDMEEAKQQRNLLKKSLSRRHMTKESSKRLEKNPYGDDDDTASQATWDDRSVSTYASSIVGSMFSRRSTQDDVASTTGRSVTSGISHSVKKWFPDLQNEVGTETEREQLKMRQKLAQAKKERDLLSRKLAKRTEENTRLLHKLEKMEGVSYDTESLLNDCDESHGTWDDQSVSTMGTSRSFVSAIFHPKILGEGSLLSRR